MNYKNLQSGFGFLRTYVGQNPEYSIQSNYILAAYILKHLGVGLWEVKAINQNGSDDEYKIMEFIGNNLFEGTWNCKDEVIIDELHNEFLFYNDELKMVFLTSDHNTIVFATKETLDKHLLDK